MQKPRQLIQPRFTLAESSRNIHVASVEHGIAWDDVQQPAFWAHVARKARRGDRIEVYTDDSSYFGELLVLDVGPAFLKVVPLRFVELMPPAGEQPESANGYAVKWSGPVLKFCVIRESDSARVHQGCAERAEAEAWITSHLKAMA